MRFLKLDAIRGLAALSVMAGHFLSEYGVERHFLNFLSDGTAAVDLFFVLSGFVLSITLKSENYYMGYVIKRICRLWPLYMASFILSSMYLGWEVAKNNIVSWMLMGFFGSVNTELLNPPAWSILVEIKQSLILPLLVLLQSKIGWYWQVAISFALTALGMIYADLDWLRFTVLFGFGAAATEIQVRNQIATKYLIACTMIIFLLYYSRLFFPWGGTGWKHVASGLASAFIIVILTSQKNVFNLLQNKTLIFFGKVSFSLYMLHMPLLFILKDNFNPITIVMIVVATSFISAKLIEAPSQAIGRYLSSEWARKINRC